MDEYSGLCSEESLSMQSFPMATTSLGALAAIAGVALTGVLVFSVLKNTHLEHAPSVRQCMPMHAPCTQSGSCSRAARFAATLTSPTQSHFESHWWQYCIAAALFIFGFVLISSGKTETLQLQVPEASARVRCAMVMIRDPPGLRLIQMSSFVMPCSGTRTYGGWSGEELFHSPAPRSLTPSSSPLSHLHIPVYYSLPVPSFT